MRNKNIDLKSISLTITVFLMLYLSVGLVAVNDILPNIAALILWIFILLLAVFSGDKKIDLKIYGMGIIYSAIILISGIINAESILNALKIIFMLFITATIINGFSFRTFTSAFVRVLKFLCLVSLVLWAIHLIAPQLFKFNIVRNQAGAAYSDMIFYIQRVTDGNDNKRNFGLMWEPGAFATFIALSMYLEVFCLKRNLKIVDCVLYVGTTLSTFSTTGIFSIIFLLLIILCNKKVNKGTKLNILKIICVGMAVVIIFFDKFFSTSAYSVFGKLINFFNSTGNNFSVNIRFNSVTKVFSAFFSKPIFGWGYEGLRAHTLEYTFGMNTCTFANWFGVYGGIFGVLAIIGLYKLSGFFMTGRAWRWIFVAFIFLITISEDYVSNPIILIFTLYGYKSKGENYVSDTGNGKKQIKGNLIDANC